MVPTDILNYRVVRPLGSGGMGTVYLAVNTSIDQEVAIKVLRPEVARSTTLRTLFKQEAVTLSQLNHPGIVKFLNYVERPDGVYLIMEYVKGITLEDFITKKNGLIVEKKAYPIIREILDAFAYAHSKGIVHCDIKPSNIVIQDNGHVKVMDFGIAQIVSQANAIDKQVNMGTPSYMSPEQVYGRKVDNRSDLYSIGVLIHTMLTGRPPYDTTRFTLQEIKRAVAREALPRMADFYPYVGDKIQQVVDKATAKNPDDRYANCEEMAAAVKQAINPEPIPKPLLYGGIAAVVLVLLTGFFTWDYYRTKVEYYRDYVEVRGIPHGIGSLSSREMSHREGSYRFEYRKHKLRRVSYVNSKDKLISHHDSETKDRLVDMELVYTEGSDCVDFVKLKDQSGRVLYVKDYDGNFKTCIFKLDDELGTEMSLNAQTELFESAFDNANVKGKSRISKYILTYDENGYLLKEEYATFGSVRVADGQGIYGRRYVRDDKGRVVEEHYLDKDGKDKSMKFGLGIKKFEYDDDDNLVQITYLTKGGEPSHDGNNCPVVKFDYDKWGNRVRESYTDIKGRPTLRKDQSCAGLEYSYDDDGFCYKHRYFGVDSTFAYVFGACGKNLEYDENGYLRKQSYVNSKDQLTYYKDVEDGFSYAIAEFKNDEHGNVLEFKMLDAEGQFIESSKYSGYVCTYDSVGRELTHYDLNEQGKIAVSPELGYAGYEATYDPQGRLAMLTFCDEKKRPIMRPKEKYSSSRYEYDERSNLKKVDFLDEKKQLTNTNEGMATIVREYDENGNCSAFSYLDKNGNPCVMLNYCARAEYLYDNDGNQIMERYLNTAGKLMAVGNVAYKEFKYDNRGNIVSERAMTAGNAFASPEIRYAYDSRDNITEQSYFAAGNKPTLCANGYHKVVSVYNSNNQPIQTKYLGTNGKLVNFKGENYALVKREYDERGNQRSIVFFTAQGTRGCDNSKVHKYFYEYNLNFNLVSHQISYGIDGNPVTAQEAAPEGRCTYDRRGQLVTLACYDGYGKRTNGKRGWHETRMTYDKAGMRTSEAYFALDGKRVSDSENKYHKITYAYDDQQNITELSVYGNDDKLMLLPGGYCTMKKKYNGKNENTEISYFGTKGQPVNCKNGWHREVYTYKGGNQSTVTCYDTKGKKVLSASKKNGEWNVPSSNTGMWLQAWKEASKMCPFAINEDACLESIDVSSQRITVYFRILNESITSLPENVNKELQSLVRSLKKETGTPSYVNVVCIVFSAHNDILATS